MLLKDNFSETLLISEKPVWFYIQDNGLKELKPIQMRLISTQQMLTNPYLQTIIALLNLPNSELKKAIGLQQTQFESLWDLLVFLKTTDPKNLYVLHFEYLLQYCFEEQYQSAKNGWFISGIVFDKNWFVRLQDIILIECGLKEYKDQRINDSLKPQWLIDKEEEIRRIKSQGKSGKEGTSNDFQELLRVLMPLSYEFKYTLEQLMEMNYFHIKMLSTYIPRIVSYDVRKHQPLAKSKIKYINEK